jgi:hypothetical protein
VEPERGAIPPAAKERAPHGGEVSCSGSICRRLGFLTVSLGKPHSNKAIRCCLPTPEVCGGRVPRAAKPSAQERGCQSHLIRWPRPSAARGRPCPSPGLPRTRPHRLVAILDFRLLRRAGRRTEHPLRAEALQRAQPTKRPPALPSGRGGAAERLPLPGGSQSQATDGCVGGFDLARPSTLDLQAGTPATQCGRRLGRCAGAAAAQSRKTRSS